MLNIADDIDSICKLKYSKRQTVNNFVDTRSISDTHSSRFEGKFDNKPEVYFKSEISKICSKNDY